MPPSNPNPEAGRRLRAARERLRLSTRDVERLSRAIAEQKKNQEYYISHAWLTDIENGRFTPGIYKLYTLSTIYQYSLDQVLAFFEINIGDIGREQLRLPMPYTHLVGRTPEGTRPVEITSGLIPGVQTDRTDLVSRMFSGFSRLEQNFFPAAPTDHSVYGYVGTKDFTLFPLIRPGSFVEIDSQQRKVMRSGWATAFERPIYFVELREEYACCWCEEREGSLLLMPCPESHSRVREVRFPDEAEIIGRVTAVTMRLVEAAREIF